MFRSHYFRLSAKIKNASFIVMTLKLARLTNLALALGESCRGAALFRGPDARNRQSAAGPERAYHDRGGHASPRPADQRHR